MVQDNRRRFLKTSGAGLAFGASLPLFSIAQAGSANERVQHAVIGVGGQGRSHTNAFSSLKDDCVVVAVCDVDPQHRAQAAGMLPNADSVKQVEDYRRILEDAQVDSVSIATPDHWHTKIAIEALQAGKHVYVEKPCCHNLREGEWLLQAAQKTGLCVQHGTQGRSARNAREAIELLHGGKLGKVRAAKAINHQFRGPIGHKPESEPPAGVNYDLWQGPAPQHAFTENRWHYNWHWFWDYGTGDIGNDGIHQLDVARWGLNVSHPKAIVASGGQYFYDDDHETPDTQLVSYEYGDCMLIFEMRLWTDYPMEGHDNAVIFYGDKGTLEVGRGGCKFSLIGSEPETLQRESEVLEDHVRNFLSSLKANDPSNLHAPAHEAVLSASLCHWGNIGTRLGQKIVLDPNTHHPVNNSDAEALMKRTYRSGYEIPVL